MNHRNINCLPLPNWVDHILTDYGGLRQLDVVSLDDIGVTNTIDCLVVFEDQYLDEKTRRLLINALEGKNINTLIIFNPHVFFFDKELLDELDKLAANFDIHVLCQGNYSQKYDNINLHHFELAEHTISHHFNLLLSTRLQARRNPEKTFLMQVVQKDQFRKTVMQGITVSQIGQDVISPVRKDKGSWALFEPKIADLREFIKEKYPNDIHAQAALNGFGNGIPNFPLYEKSFCEVVIETKNTGAYHFTEKIFRPIALCVPIIFLGSKAMYEELYQYGYRFYDLDFYKYWHDESTPLEERVARLVSFMQHIKDDEGAREQMTYIANNNHQLFWNERKLYYYQNWNNILDQICKGKNIERIVESVYSQCNF
jgi:hypothetical protein